MNELKPIAVTSKRSLGVLPVYDISVPEQHHYILENGVVSHNSGFIYASSIVVAMKKLKLKEDEDGNKISDVMGIRSACKVMKTRYAKPFEGVQVKIPYSTGMSPYSGLVDLAEKKGLLKKDGNRLAFTTADGEVIKKFRKAWESNEEGCLDMLITQFNPVEVEVEVDTDDEYDNEATVNENE